MSFWQPAESESSVTQFRKADLTIDGEILLLAAEGFHSSYVKKVSSTLVTVLENNVHAHISNTRDSVVRNRIKDIAAEVFQKDVTSIELAMGPDEIDNWDSLNHLRLITEVEASFSLRLTMQQIQKIESLEDIAQLVAATML